MASPANSEDNLSFEDAAEGNHVHAEDDADRTAVPQSSASARPSSASEKGTFVHETIHGGPADLKTVPATIPTDVKSSTMLRKASGGGFAALKARFEKAPQASADVEEGVSSAGSTANGTTSIAGQGNSDIKAELQGNAESCTPPIPPSEGAKSLLDPQETITNPFGGTTTPGSGDSTPPWSPHSGKKRPSNSSSRSHAGVSDHVQGSSVSIPIPDTPPQSNRFSVISLSTTLPPSPPGSSKRDAVAPVSEESAATGSSEFLVRNTARLSTMADGQNQRSADSNAEHFKEKLNELRYTHSRESSVASKADVTAARAESANGDADGEFGDGDEKHESIQSMKTARHPADVGSDRPTSWDGPPVDEVQEEHIDWDFWGDVMSNYQQIAKTQPRKLSRAIQAGIPAALRGMMWQLMSSSKDEEMEIIYAYYLKQTSPHEKMIRKDLARTFPGQDYFRDGNGIGQENLFNVVKAYSLYDEECGYCQGMQFVVGPLLLNMPDEEAFSTLVRLMKSYDLRGHFVPNMPSLQLRLFQFERLLEEFLPLLHRHLVRQGIKSSMYASGWIMTLFTYRSPLAICFRILDSVFAEGIEALFRFALALMLKNEEQLLSMTFDEAVPLLAGRIFEVYKREDDGMQTPNPNRGSVGEGQRSSSGATASLDECKYRVSEFVRDAFQFKITPFMLDSYASDFAEQVKVATAHRREMDALKTENRSLQMRIKSLENQLGAVQEEHVDLVKSVVMAKLAREEMAEELMRYKMMYAEAALLVDQSGAGSQQQTHTQAQATTSPSSSGATSMRQSRS